MSDRNSEGKFVARPDSLARPIPVRLKKGDREEFEAIAAELGELPSVLARQIVSEWLEAHRQSSKSGEGIAA